MQLFHFFLISSDFRRGVLYFRQFFWRVNVLFLPSCPFDHLAISHIYLDIPRALWNYWLKGLCSYYAIKYTMLLDFLILSMSQIITMKTRFSACWFIKTCELRLNFFWFDFVFSFLLGEMGKLCEALRKLA